MKVIVHYTDNLDRKEYNNVLQVDYIQLEEKQYADRIWVLSLLLSVDKETKKATRYNIDLRRDITLIVLDEKGEIVMNDIMSSYPSAVQNFDNAIKKYIEEVNIMFRYRYSMYYHTSLPATNRNIIKLKMNSRYGILMTASCTWEGHNKNQTIIKYEVLKYMIKYRLLKYYGKEL